MDCAITAPLQTTTRPRAVLKAFTPVWDGPVESWTNKYAAANAWRVAPEWGTEDIIQEGRILFWKVSTRYKAQNARHFMGLYMRSLSNRLTNMAKRTTQRRHVCGVTSLVGDTGHTLADLAGLDKESAAASEAQAERATATGPVGNLLRKLTDVSSTPRYQRAGGVRETTAQFLARLAEVDYEHFNIVGAVLDYLLGEDAS